MTQTSPAANRDKSKAERVYRELRRRIRELTLPPGAPLRKEEIALEMGVSRAPVSEAIARLADEALVDVFPQPGAGRPLGGARIRTHRGREPRTAKIRARDGFRELAPPAIGQAV